MARACADLRSCGMAVEAYTVDYNGPPLGPEHLMDTDNQCGIDLPSLTWNNVEFFMWNPLTTPVAYMASLPRDVFAEKNYMLPQGALRKVKAYGYQTYPQCLGGDMAKLKSIGFAWAMWSIGPTRQSKGDVVKMFKHAFLGDIKVYGDEYTVYPYDPSNGTMSRGWPVRSNKGAWPAF